MTSDVVKKRKSASKAANSQKNKAGAKPRAKKTAQPAGDEITQSAAFRRASLEAEAYARDPERLRRLLADAITKTSVIPRGPFGEAWPYLLAMLRLIREYQRGEYRDLPAAKFFIVVAAIIYFVSPFDVIPDWVPVLGHIDDAFVVSLALKSVRAELDAFMGWETARI